MHRTVRCTTGHCTVDVRCTPRQPTVGACSSRPLDPTVAVCPLAHRTVRCYSQRAPVCGLSAQTVWCLTGQSGAHRTPMSGAPPGAGWQPLSWNSSLISSGFFVLEYWTPMHLFMSSFRCCILIALVQFSSHPVNYKHKHWNTLLVHGLCCSSNTKTQLAKRPGVHFPYNLPLFGDWWQHNQSKQIIQVFELKSAIYLLECMIVPTMWHYGLKPPPNSIIHLLPIFGPNNQNHLKSHL